mmetsp:Transcript_16893/g.48238  ORF Transcript_16893/g.48238 Transcript_16893/m.48238 type:complete len:89 (-) Transcript_16893:823-1089(-)
MRHTSIPGHATITCKKDELITEFKSRTVPTSRLPAVGDMYTWLLCMGRKLLHSGKYLWHHPHCAIAILSERARIYGPIADFLLSFTLQ